MKKLFLLTTFLFFSLPLVAQNGAINRFCDNGANHSSTSGLQSSNYMQGIIPQCHVAVYYTGSTILAPIYATGSDSATVSSVTILSGGNYSVCPTGVSFSGGSGSGAAATVACTGTAITSVTMTNPGSGYTSAPTVSFTGGTGSAASAYANLAGTLSNPFTANSDGSYLFFSANNQGLDVVMSGGLAPNTYASPRTVTDIFPSQSFSPVSGVVSINTVAGAFTFTGSGVSCVGTTCTFSGGGGGGVTSLNSLTGALSLTSTDSSVTITPSGSTINLSVAGGGACTGCVTYNASNSAYVWMADSSIGSDDHAISSTITVTSVSYVGSGGTTTVTMTNSGNNGLAALVTADGNAWVDTQGITSPAFLNTGNCIQSYNMATTGVCIFPVTVIDSTHFSFTYPSNQGTGSGTGGTAYTANSYLPIWVQNHEPYFKGHGVMGMRTGIVYNESLTSNFTTHYSALAPTTTGHPAWLIMSNDQDVYFTAFTGSCTANAIEGYYQNVWGQAHALGYKIAQTTTRAGSQNTSVAACSNVNGPPGTGLWETVETWKRQQKCNASSSVGTTNCYDQLIDQWAIPGGGQSTPFQIQGRLTYAGITNIAPIYNEAMVSQGESTPKTPSLIPNGAGWDVWNPNGNEGNALRVGGDFNVDLNGHRTTVTILNLGGFCCTPGGNGDLAYVGNAHLYFDKNGTIVDLLAGTSPTFNSIGSGTNTTAAMLVGTGASLGPTGTGTIQATNISGTIAAGSGASVTGSGTVASPYTIAVTGSGPASSTNISVTNEGVTGTTLNTLTKITGAPSTAIIAATTDTGGVVGITTSGAGTTSTASIQVSGLANCVFSGATTANHYVGISAATAGNCVDAGATYPTSGQVIGRVLTTNASGGTYQIDIFPPEIQGTSGGGGSVPAVPTVLDTSTPVTVSTTNNAEYHFNQNATAGTAVTYNLPTASAGKQFCFSNSNNGTSADTGVLTVATSASGQFIVFTDGTLSATGGNVTSGGAAADAACVVGLDSTHWMLYTQRGTWTKH